MPPTSAVRRIATITLIYAAIIQPAYVEGIIRNPIRSTCGSHEYRCENGQCIAAEKFCDDIDNCDDGSDEKASNCGYSADAPSTELGSQSTPEKSASNVTSKDDSDPNSRIFFGNSPSRSSGGLFGSLQAIPQDIYQGVASVMDVTTLLGYCAAPPQPENGKWERDVTTTKDIYVGLDLVFKPGRRLHYSCDPGYVIKGNPIVYCDISKKWTEIPICSKIACPSLNSASTIAVCSRYGEWTSCDATILPNTTAQLSCQKGYKKDTAYITDQATVRCNGFGVWIPDPIKCVPECGVAGNSRVSRAYNASPASVADFPWHTTLYREVSSGNVTKKMFTCGGTIVHLGLVVTAAHCVYDETTRRAIDASRLYLLTGNTFVDYDTPFHNPNVVRRARVQCIHIYPKYFGYEGNYAADIAMLILERPFEPSDILMPACLDISKKKSYILEPDSYGRVAGFGRTETAPSSANLRTLSLPYVPFNECHSRYIDTEYEVFITPDKFCAGYTNGTAVCDGDSGGGLVFEKFKLWFIKGIVSVGIGVDTTNGQKTCNRYSYSLYTDVSKYVDWIREIIFRLGHSGSYALCNSTSI